MSDVLRIETVNAIEEEQRRRRNLRKTSCSTCHDWADVIHSDYDGRRLERWHLWPEPDHRCPACSREPEVLVLKWGFDPGGVTADSLHRFERSFAGACHLPGTPTACGTGQVERIPIP